MRKKRQETLRYRRRYEYEQARRFSYLLRGNLQKRQALDRQVAELFTRYRVWDYVYSCFEALHTTGANYIVEDIDLYIEARKPAMA